MTQSERIEAVASMIAPHVGKARKSFAADWSDALAKAQSIDALYAELEGEVHRAKSLCLALIVEAEQNNRPLSPTHVVRRDLASFSAALAKHKSPQEDEVQR